MCMCTRDMDPNSNRRLSFHHDPTSKSPPNAQRQARLHDAPFPIEHRASDDDNKKES
ncbi:hypothetical protein SERLA73DRAFT_133128 [Serpula lacrymans var. lacrymans S7.3]|uniref:Uncharacterized protein n=1 Tax=Serpula lacrymans var. lacrymans (strain S7.3) TaxID=936435 RepID=F8PQH7_SERL3|nr:hypothetical protein SERLA73DRAFT_133128 [Serpula lacrymans var. lacrymans S7.3]